MARRSTPCWIVISKDGHAFVGAERRRRRAIAEHVNALDEVCYREGHGGYSRLSKAQRAAWKKLRKEGHRCVKATLTWTV